VRLFVGHRAAKRQIAGFPIGGDFAGVDFARQIAVHHPLRPSRRPQTSTIRIDAGNSGHQPVGFRQVEAWIHSESHDGRSGFRGSHAGQHRKDALIIHTYVDREIPAETELPDPDGCVPPNWSSPGSSPVSAPRSNIVTMTTFTEIGLSAERAAIAKCKLMAAKQTRVMPVSYRMPLAS
jgi:hypothetical protein